MVEDFDKILDQCIDRINRGESIADCLSDYPAYARSLKPLLESIYGIQKAYPFTPSPDAKRAARQKFYAALDRRSESAKRFPFSAIPRPVVWATVAAVVMAIIGILVIRPALDQPAMITIPEDGPVPGIPEDDSAPATPEDNIVPSSKGNFVFLISDEPNDIGDFESLNVTISEVGLQSTGDSQGWVDFTPEIMTVDLTQVQGEQSQEIWRGDVPEGVYSQVFIYVSKVEGQLKLTGETIDVKLPSSRLHISKPFEITNDMLTSFIFDITVMETGKSGRYILKPQISESGAHQEQKFSG